MPVVTLERTIGPLGASGIGLASMVGAGVFYVWGPAASLAGEFLLVSLMIAGAIAMLNALSMAQLAMLRPVSGGAYSYGREFVSPGVGFMAGWLFLVGKTASAGAIAVIAARYIAPESVTVIAPVVVAVFALANMTGLRTTATVGLVIVAVVIVLLVAISVGAPWGSANFGWAPETGIYGVAQAAGLMFFAFAGYARMATLGAEVRNPRTVLPRVMVGTLVAVLALYALVGAALVNALGFQGLAGSVAPVAEAAPDSWAAAVTVVAVAASLGSLITILAGLSRTAMAMATEGDLPRRLGVVWGRRSSPVVAEATMGLCAMVIAAFVDPLWLVGVSSAAVLGYYAIAHLAAYAAMPPHSGIRRVIPVLGVMGCGALVATLPWPSLVAGAIAVGVGLIVWFFTRRTRR